MKILKISSIFVVAVFFTACLASKSASVQNTPNKELSQYEALFKGDLEPVNKDVNLSKEVK